MNKKKHTIAQTMQSRRLGLPLSSESSATVTVSSESLLCAVSADDVSCAAAVSCAAVVLCQCVVVVW